MEASEIALRLIGAFYVFAGFVATRAALTSHMLDKALAAIGGKGLSRVERAISTWHLSAAGLVLLSGLALLMLLDAALWLFIASALGQAVYLYIVAPSWFDVEDPPDPKGRQQTTNAFFVYCAATALVGWAAYTGMLRTFQDVGLLELALTGSILAAHVGYVVSSLAGWSGRNAE